MPIATIHRHYRIAVLALALSPSVVGDTACVPRFDAATVPSHLSAEEFWSLSAGLSEPPGVFTHSDTLVSNEVLFAHTIRMLRPRGGVYIGVGPEQNFSYIARLQPAMAFIIDIRQENRNLHLMYKALFESSTDRADFLSRLFSRERPAGLNPLQSVDELFAAYGTTKPSGLLHEATARLVRERLLQTHGFPLSPDDLRSIDYALGAFYSDGPDIHYGRTRASSDPRPSYRSLMTATDARGVSRSYLATEEAFAFVKDLHARNLIVPVVGDFGAPGAIKRVGDYTRQRGSVISAFYGSNVEVYLSRDQIVTFCGSLATLPYNSRTSFIGSQGLEPLTSKLQTCESLGKPAVSGRKFWTHQRRNPCNDGCSVGRLRFDIEGPT
jgi:hypothetical protein